MSKLTRPLVASIQKKLHRYNLKKRSNVLTGASLDISLTEGETNFLIEILDVNDFNKTNTIVRFDFDGEIPEDDVEIHGGYNNNSDGFYCGLMFDDCTYTGYDLNIPEKTSYGKLVSEKTYKEITCPICKMV